MRRFRKTLQVHGDNQKNCKSPICLQINEEKTKRGNIPSAIECGTVQSEWCTKEVMVG